MNPTSATSVQLGGAAAQPETSSGLLGGASAFISRRPSVKISRAPVDLPTFATTTSTKAGPLTSRSVAAERAKRLAQHEVMLRPVRLLAVGKEQPYTPEDRAFLEYVKVTNSPLLFQSPCPKKTTTACDRRYLKYRHAKSFREAIELGASAEDFLWDYRRGWIRFPKLEPQITGYVFNALELAAEHGYTHALEDAGLLIVDYDGNKTLLASAFNVRGQRASFNRILETVFEPKVILKFLDERDASLRWAEQQMAKVLNSSTINIDFSLEPEPVRYQDVQLKCVPSTSGGAKRWMKRWHL